MKILAPNQLCVVAVVAQLGSVRKAANKLNRTQPTISNTIRAAEKSMQTRLFVRRCPGPKCEMIPTAPARKILAAFEPALECMTSIEESLSQLSGNQKVITLHEQNIL